MKLAWFTPLAQGSAVSDLSRLVCERLLQHHIEPELFIPASQKDRVQQTTLPIHFFQGADDLKARLDQFDLSVYVMGNFLDNHTDIFQMLWKRKGIVLLHDMAYWDFFEQYFNKVGDPRVGLQFASYWAGDQHMQAPILSHAYGAIVHSNAHMELVKQHFAGPHLVQELPLLYEPVYMNATPLTDRKLRILVLGTMNRNKLLSEIIEAVASSEKLVNSVELLLAGKSADPAYAKELEELDRNYPWVALRTNISAEEKDRLVGECDICLNLRYPSIEGASETVLEELARGKTVIVLNTGSFRDLPKELVIKIDHETWEEQLVHQLEKLLSNPESITAYRSRALSYMQSHHRIDDYAAHTARFLRTVLTKLPWMRTIDSLVENLKTLPEAAREVTIKEISSAIPNETS